MPEASYHDERFWSRYLARRAAPCPRCRYELRGGRSPVCPECGHVTSLAELRLQADPIEEQWHMSGAWALSAAAILGLIPGVTLMALAATALAGNRTGVLAGLSEPMVALGFGLAIAAGPYALLLLWRRGARRVHRLPEVVKWTLVFFASGLALAGAMGTLATIALVGTSLAGK